MLTAAQLAGIVSRTVELRRCGPNRVEGTLSLSSRGHPSFHVYRGRDGRGRYHCHGTCKADGDAVDWLRKVENKSYREAGGVAPDPQIERDRKERHRMLTCCTRTGTGTRIAVSQMSSC